MVYKILFVDDEKDILSSLKRLFMEDWCEVFTASSGLVALELIKKEHVDIIVSDQRMPEIEGVEFLKQSKEYLPDSIRMLLTGYADVNAAIESINEGEVSKYITKPWNNDELKATIHDALELRKLKKENANLLELTQKQNLELKDLNSNLEEKVKEQTKELRNMFDELKVLYSKIDKSFMNTVMVLSNVISMKECAISLRFKNTSKLSIAIANELGFLEDKKKDLKIASLLHDIGLIGINDRLLNKAFDNMTSPERVEYMKHPLLGQAVLESIENMEEVGVIIRHHHERWDGEGYPDNIDGEQIPVCSRIISITSDYEALMNGTIFPLKFTSYEARQFIIENSGKRYEPKIVAIFAKILPAMEKKIEEKPEFRVLSSELEAGMILSRDVLTERGLLLMNEGWVINEKHIKNIINFEKSEGKRYEIYVSSKSANP